MTSYGMLRFLSFLERYRAKTKIVKVSYFNIENTHTHTHTQKLLLDNVTFGYMTEVFTSANFTNLIHSWMLATLSLVLQISEFTQLSKWMRLL